MLAVCARLESAFNLGAHATLLCCTSGDRMPSGEDDDLSILRALADDLILDVADRDPARVIKAVVEVCARLAAERHISTQELQTAVEVLLLEWQEQSSGRPSGLTEQADRVCTETSCARAERERQRIRAQDLARAILQIAIPLSQKIKRPGSGST
jgi:hypothetical protein